MQSIGLAVSVLQSSDGPFHGGDKTVCSCVDAMCLL